MPNEPVKITAQELEEIKKLPSCQFMLGGTPQTGFFDKVNEKIYYLDSEGNWMVKRARVKKREPEKPKKNYSEYTAFLCSLWSDPVWRFLWRRYRRYK